MNEILLRYKNELSAAAIVLVFFFIINAILSGHAMRMTEFKKKEIEFSENKTHLERLLKLDEELQDIRARFLFRDNRSFLRMIEEKSKGLGINISYLRPTQREGDFYQELVVDLGVVASLYNDLLDFIRSIEEENVFIEQLEVNQKNEAKIVLRGLIAK
ncbi:MAG: hypothetical protein JSW17_05405 [Candidatus Omnitrophota bacterium]|nr:MAG: hypothetical protein JSW17_05405 [Candidatus Omnitrophota bacterium]